MMTQTNTPDKRRGDVFSFTEMAWNDGVARFGFRCSTYGDFTEEVRFDTSCEVPEGLLRLLHVALGVSTYKAAAARRVEFPALTPGGRAMAEALYSEGLAEFFVRAGLSYPPGTVFEGGACEPSVSKPSEWQKPLVAFGGGKDSYVAGRIVEEAFGAQPQYASVVLSPAVKEVLTRTAPTPPLFIERSLDPKLLAVEDGFTGHVPITAINILVLTIAGYLRGQGPILFANERSADEPTLQTGDVVANHQYSKSSAFEGLVRNAVAEAAPDAPPIYSVLRPFSELWIARRFADISSAFGRFTSCNRNFRLAGDADKRWCGECAKCAFTSLILSPFLSEDEALAIFGRIMLDQEELQPIYEELCGLSEQKPWDCVGTIDECQAALYLLSKDERWTQTAAVERLMPRLLTLETAASLAGKVDAAMTPDARGALPSNLYDAALML